MEKHTEIGISNPAEMHLWLDPEGLVARQLVAKFGGKQF